MRKVREVIKEHLDKRYIDKDTPVIICDRSRKLSATGCMGSEVIRKDYEREVENVSCMYRTMLIIYVKENDKKKSTERNNENMEFGDLLMELTEKAQMQQTVHNMLYLMEQWDDTSMSAIRARSALEFWKKDINEEIENLQRSIDACQGVQPDAHTDEEGGIEA